MTTEINLSDTVIRLDGPEFSPHAQLSGLLRWQEPLRDTDVAGRTSGHDASGLNAAIAVLRQVYRVLLTLQMKACSSGDSFMRTEHDDALETLRKNEEHFSLLAAAWLNIPRRSGSHDMQGAIRQAHKEVLDLFFQTWQGPPGDLSFSSILASEQARENVWGHRRFFLFMPLVLVEQPVNLWAKPNTRLADRHNTRFSLVEWAPERAATLTAHLQSSFVPKQSNGRTVLPIPNYPSVLRVRYTPRDDDFEGLQEADLPDMRLQEKRHLTTGETFFRTRIGPQPCAYKLVAVVRLRNHQDEPDLVRLFDLETPSSLGPEPAFGPPSWRLGAAGHKYDLFYARVRLSAGPVKEVTGPSNAMQAEEELTDLLVAQADALTLSPWLDETIEHSNGEDRSGGQDDTQAPGAGNEGPYQSSHTQIQPAPSPSGVPRRSRSRSQDVNQGPPKRMRYGSRVEGELDREV